MIRRLTCILLLLVMTVSGCALTAPALTPSPEQTAESSPAAQPSDNTIASDGIMIAAEHAQYPVGVQDITLLWTNRSDGTCIYGESFSLERKTNEGWEALFLIGGVGFDGIANTLGANSTRAQKLEISRAYGRLELGEYRIVTQATDEKSGQVLPLWAEFAVASAPGVSPIPLPASIPGVTELTAGEISHITYRDESISHERIWTTQKDIAQALAALQSIRLTAYAGGQQDPAKWDGRYLINCFDGRTFKVDFSGNMLTDGENFYEYEEDAKGLPAKSMPQPGVYLEMKRYSYTAGAKEIGFAVVNDTADTVPVVMAPMLEQSTNAGWKKLRVEGGFCGTPDPVKPGRYETTIPMALLYPDAAEGVYRLSLTGYNPDGSTYALCTVFATGGKDAI